MKSKIYVPYKKYGRNLIQEGDILLFRGTGVASWFISKASEGKHTHVGVASWNENRLQIVEFREGNPLALIFGGNVGGGRTMTLSSQVKKFDGLIDVYRPTPKYYFYTYSTVCNKPVEQTKFFDAKRITNELRSMNGVPYGWKQILGFLKYSGFGLRLIYNTSRQLLDDEYPSQSFPVCSTSLAALFRKHYIDIVNNKSDQATTPSDFSRSPVLSYLFTLKWDENFT